MSRSESKSAGAARKKIQETGVAHGHAHSSMSTRKNEPKTAHVAENCSRRKFLHEGALSTANKILHAARNLHAQYNLLW